MKTFLQMVAHDLHDKIGNDLSHVALVFPNKRAGLFFNEYLAFETKQPVWSPNYLTITELYQQLSAEKLADPLRLVCELYKVYREETLSEETLDDFYFWGELLINDFDDIDKNLVNADKLLSNLQDLKNIMDDFEFLDPEQEKSIRQFFQNFSVERRTQLKEKFISLWDKLGDIYRHYKRNLLHQGIAYEGMLYRNVTERLNPNLLKYEKYVFVGFNALNKAEANFFRYLRDAGKALFYWDYDIFYTHMPTSRHEGGEFLKRNLTEFPNELPQEWFDCLRKDKKVRYISAPTENAQARYLPQWIRDTLTGDEKENAVVLCNEALLLPVLHSIPSDVNYVNITMGFPLAQTPVYSFINAVLDLQTKGYRTDTGRYLFEAVQTILKHPYTRQLSPQAEFVEQQLTRSNRFYPLPSELKQDDFLAKVFTPCLNIKALCTYLTDLLKEISVLYRHSETEESPETETKTASADLFNQLYRESLFKSYTMINRFIHLIEEGVLPIRIDTLRHLLTRVLRATHIPFHGEPAIGLQIMGILETRNLDFKNLIMLSLNEGQLPKGGGESSFIPYNLRKTFGMTTVENKNAVYAYYFYRLLQRAENITLLYNTSSEGLNRGEWSRFMLQFLVEWPHPITRLYLEAGQSPQTSKEIRLEKVQEIVDVLHRSYNFALNGQAITLSPSALNTYMDCRMKFYFQYIARLQAPEEVSATIDSALFGTIFHRSAELIYQDLTANGKMIHKEDLERLLRNEPRLDNYVATAFKEKFFHVSPEEKPEYNGLQLINSKVIASYLRQLLRNDLQYAPFEMVGMEIKVKERIEISTCHGPVQLQIGGTIDRLDRKEGVLRIVDYKTGGSPKIPANIEQLFTPAEGRPNYIFQTFLYAAIVNQKEKCRVAPSLLYIHRASSETYSPVIEIGEPRKTKVPVTDFSLFEEEFRERFKVLLEEIYNPQEPFTQTEDIKKCGFCDLKGLCGK